MRRIGPLLLAIVGLIQIAFPAGAAHQTACAGLDEFGFQIFTVGHIWLDGTQRAGVIYTADPSGFDAQQWTAFAELATIKQDRLDAIDPPTWAAEWLEIQIDAAALQAEAGNAASKAGLSAIATFGDDFRALEERDQIVTADAIDHCGAFAPVASTWQLLNRDF